MPSFASSSNSSSLISRPLSIIEPLNLAEIFPHQQPLEIELGSGDGSFITRYAAAHPEKNFIGVERLLGRLRKINRKGLRAGLGNLRLFRIEASYFLRYLLPARSIDALHVYFPDPWPKRKHRKNRLIDETFVDTARIALKSGSPVYLRTDDRDYFTQMQRVFDASLSFEKAETTAELQQVVTDFEREFQKRGVATLRAAYRLR